MTAYVRLVIRALATVVLAAIGWAVVGYVATAPLGAIYGWGGHPAMPSAPWSVYVALYFVTLPAVCLIGGWFLAGRLVTAVMKASMR